MKILSKLLFLLSVAWLLAVNIQPLGPLIRSSVQPLPIWLRYLLRLPKPPSPFGPMTWATLWPIAIGLAGVVVSIGIAEWIKRAEKCRERSEA